MVARKGGGESRAAGEIDADQLFRAHSRIDNALPKIVSLSAGEDT